MHQVESYDLLVAWDMIKNDYPILKKVLQKIIKEMSLLPGKDAFEPIEKSKEKLFSIDGVFRTEQEIQFAISPNKATRDKAFKHAKETIVETQKQQ